MKNALSRAARPRNALSMGYIGPTKMAERAAPNADDAMRLTRMAEASMIPGVSDAAAGVLAVDAARKGNYGEAALNAVGVLPFVPALGGIFVGKGAKTWDALRAAEAQRMLDAGADPKAVWQQTGTFKGADGELRQEIDDSTAKIIPQSGIALEYMADYGQAMYPSTVRSVVSHPNLLNAYGDIGDVKVMMRNKPSGGAYSPARSATIGEGLELPMKHREDGSIYSPDQAKSTTLHELQHAIQQREGWAMGGSPEQFDVGSYESLVKRSSAEQDAYMRAKSAGGIDPETGRSLQTIEQNISGLSEQIKDWQDPHEQYRRLAGEAEARAVQKRMNYGPEQRRAVYPFDDYDVPLNSLILRTNR